MSLIDNISFFVLLVVDGDQEEQFANNMLRLEKRFIDIYLKQNNNYQLKTIVTMFFLIKF